MAITTKLGVIGAGKMAGALVKGWIRSGVVKPDQVNNDDDDDDYDELVKDDVDDVDNVNNVHF